MAVLKKGQSLRSMNGGTIVVETLLGEGGQGYVYKVDYNGKPMALKWYKADELKDSLNWFYNNLKNNISKGSPNSDFLWPVDLTEWVDGTFGYIMPLRPQGYEEFPAFLMAQVEFEKFSCMVDAALNIVMGFKILHNRGYTYQDLNDGNFFIDPKNGKVLICDNDNVAESGENSGIVGKARYMAPLVVVGKKMPDKITDRFSMAVVLFMLFMRNHPLEGKAVQKKVILTENYQKKYYGENPVFIADPTNDTNGPTMAANRNFLIRWPLMSKDIRDLFIAAFSKDAMAEKASSPIEMVWCRKLLQYKSDLIYCPHCGKQIVFDHDKPVCMKCKQPLNISAYLSVGHYMIPAVKGSTLCMEHLIDFDDERYDPTIIGEIICAKNDSSAIGLKNLSDGVWQYQKGGEYVKVGKGEVIHLIKGRKIKIGSHYVEVV
ncbi:serine/threonine-protein kinase [uncultured Ruminococcus sp.]|uniref:serine/threonine protein kinase n=1 Tax=uncultured Ruminococcus sp. TaxID=165186 RepID=UPI0025D95A55|nr:serine/threonine-protein kinase [uncultured Ruminococcus sp.]